MRRRSRRSARTTRSRRSMTTRSNSRSSCHRAPRPRPSRRRPGASGPSSSATRGSTPPASSTSAATASLAEQFVPAGGAGEPEFVGALFPDAFVTRVILTLGRAPSSASTGRPSPPGTAGRDLAITDDFVYAEPVPRSSLPPILPGPQGTIGATPTINATVGASLQRGRRHVLRHRRGRDRQVRSPPSSTGATGTPPTGRSPRTARAASMSRARTRSPVPAGSR